MQISGDAILAVKIVGVLGIVTQILWVILYTILTRHRNGDGKVHWEAWRNPVGLTLIIEALTIAGLLVLTLLTTFFPSMFAQEEILIWCEVGLLAVSNAVMIWRTLVFLRIGRSADPPTDAPEKRLYQG